MRRLPIRLRVAAAFAVAMALVLTATGIFVYARLSRDLGTALDQQLRLRAEDLSQLVRDPRGSLGGEPAVHFIERGESFAQLVSPGGRVIDATAPLRGAPLIDAAGRRAALRGPRFADLRRIPGLDEGVRLLAIPVQRRQERLILVVGATAENRREALRSLRDELLIAGPVALLLATGLGYLLAGAGLRAVDAMRARAERVSADQPGERLPVPPTGDELQRLGTTLNEMLDRLQAAVERERGFVAEAGHELRTPLALLRAELDYALHYAADEAELRTAIRTASDETDRLVALTGALLMIASSERGRLALQYEAIAVGELLESVRRRFAWRAAELGRPIEISAGGDLTVEADRLRIEQAVGNLVDNALRHGGGTIRLRASRADGTVTLSVGDEGPGFDAAFLPRAFQRFSRSEPARAANGSGLGLSIVETIAKAHGGCAYAANTPGAGAEVGVRLPARAPRPSASGGATPASTAR